MSASTVEVPQSAATLKALNSYTLRQTVTRSTVRKGAPRLAHLFSKASLSLNLIASGTCSLSVAAFRVDA